MPNCTCSLSAVDEYIDQEDILLRIRYFSMRNFQNMIMLIHVLLRRMHFGSLPDKSIIFINILSRIFSKFPIWSPFTAS
jgi:hypothetical protein